MPDFAHDKTILAGIYFLVVKKKKKNLVGLVFLKNIPGTETNWTSLSFLTSSFFTFFKTGTGFFRTFREWMKFQNNEKSLMAVREFQLILLESLALQLIVLPIEAMQVLVGIRGRKLSHWIDLS